MKATISPVDLEKYLSGISYPANKQMIIQNAKGKGASGDVLGALNGLPNREFADSADVSDELES